MYEKWQHTLSCSAFARPGCESFLPTLTKLVRLINCSSLIKLIFFKSFLLRWREMYTASYLLFKSWWKFFYLLIYSKGSGKYQSLLPDKIWNRKKQKKSIHSHRGWSLLANLRDLCVFCLWHLVCPHLKPWPANKFIRIWWFLKLFKITILKSILLVSLTYEEVEGFRR